MTCLKCGGLIAEAGKLYGWGGSWCPGHPEYQQWKSCPIVPTPVIDRSCDHCYCQKINPVIGNMGKADHKRCCNCGNMQKLTDMEMNIKKF